MRKAVYYIYFILIGAALLIDTYSYNQIAMEDSPIYRYHLWILVITTPLFLVNILFNFRLVWDKTLRTYGFFVLFIFLLSILQGNITRDNLITLLHIAYPFLCLSIVFVAIRKKRISIRWLEFFSFALWVSVSLIFISGWSSINAVLNFNARGMNNIYHVLLALPFCMCNRSKVLRLVTLIVTGVLCVLSLKRGAMLGYGVFILVYYFVNVNSRVISKIITIILASLFLVIGYTTIDKKSGGYVTSRFQMMNAGDNAREDIYTTVTKAIQHSSIIDLSFGHGISSVKDITDHELSAHNDFLEIIYDYGIFTLLLWILFLYRLFRNALNRIRDKDVVGTVLMASMGIILVICMFSHFFIYPYSCILMIFIAACLADSSQWSLSYSK